MCRVTSAQLLGSGNDRTHWTRALTRPNTANRNHISWSESSNVVVFVSFGDELFSSTFDDRQLPRSLLQTATNSIGSAQSQPSYMQVAGPARIVVHSSAGYLELMHLVALEEKEVAYTTVSWRRDIVNQEFVRHLYSCCNENTHAHTHPRSPAPKARDSCLLH